MRLIPSLSRNKKEIKQTLKFSSEMVITGLFVVGLYYGLALVISSRNFSISSEYINIGLFIGVLCLLASVFLFRIKKYSTPKN